MLQFKRYVLEISIDSKRIFYSDKSKIINELNLENENEFKDLKSIYRFLKKSRSDLGSVLYEFNDYEVMEYYQPNIDNDSFIGDEKQIWSTRTAVGKHIYNHKTHKHVLPDELCFDDLEAFLAFIPDYKIDKFTEDFIVIFQIENVNDFSHAVRKVSGLIVNKYDQNYLIKDENIIKKYEEYSDFRGDMKTKNELLVSFEYILDLRIYDLMKYFNVVRKQKILKKIEKEREKRLDKLKLKK